MSPSTNSVFERRLQTGRSGTPRPAKQRITFVLCPSFHGATLLALLLNNHSSVSALGDTNPTREYDQTCACGQKVSVCEFWQTIRGRVGTDRFAHLNDLLPSLPWPLANRHLEGSRLAVSGNARVNRAAGRLAATGADWLTSLAWRPGSRIVADYVSVWQSFYYTVSALHGTTMVIDGSKGIRKVGVVARALGESGDVRIIHLVRDPRGFARSFCRYTETTDLRAGAWLWAALHERMSQLSSLVPYRLVRYEDLAQRPSEEIASVFDFLSLPREDVVAPPRYPAKHHLMGNAMLATFDGTVSFDERWRTSMTVAEQERVLRHAGMFARACGYS